MPTPAACTGPARRTVALLSPLGSLLRALLLLLVLMML